MKTKISYIAKLIFYDQNDFVNVTSTVVYLFIYIYCDITIEYIIIGLTIVIIKYVKKASL